MTTLDDALKHLWTADEGAKVLQFKGAWYSWGYIRSLSESIGATLAQAGAGRGARVAVVLGNRPESVAALVSAIVDGWILVTLNPMQPSERLAADLSATGVGYVLGPAASFEDRGFTEAVVALNASSWSVDDDQVVECSRGATVAGEATSEVQIEMLTSGTTGAPKRIPLTRCQLESSLSAALSHHDRSDGRDRAPFSGAVALVIIPIVHIGGLWGVLQALTTARPMVMAERFSVDTWIEVVREHRPKLVGLPPAAIRSVLDSEITREDLSSVRAINAGTSPVSPDLIDAFLERFGIPILVVYGATEFSGAVAGWNLPDFRAHWKDKRGSVGKAFPGVMLRAVDDDGCELGPGNPGRLQVATAQAGSVNGQWITTSDLARIDADGFLYIDGRADDVIIRGGFKVAPDTVSAALRRHEAVADAAVLGVPDERLGQIPIAAVELRTSAHAEPQELREHCRLMLTSYEVPAEVYIVDQLPRGAALKVDRRGLTKIIEELRN
ncbi:fatty acid--CoA ligase family protein [Mycobacterium sp. SMC-8]|uniref:class I adenylate-forming enzyme family protein n=1 Tax=Mycobacterium sp. SMC-8 TaxID=2857060 RepID=UPI0021B48C3E|nr:fatty acid--CoA ligase family protein [Mycobacterium sp. SMC-8]UXA11555.1 fatty acid--CoA ligase family protein [Mycobacterium sp. SMC-8]